MDQEEAERWGILPGYHDVFGEWHAPTPAALEAITRSLRAKHAARLGAAPSAILRAYQCGTRKMWGLAVQLYAVRSARNWGHGDFGDLAALIRGAAAAGAGAVGLNPLHALFPERAEDASPYSPNSRLFLNWLYIDVEALPDFPGYEVLENYIPGLRDEIEALRSADMVQYGRLAAVKFAALKICHASFQKNANAERRKDFARYVDEGGNALAAFAAFEVLRARYQSKFWREWPEQDRAPSRRLLTTLTADERTTFDFQLYLQWVAASQLHDCQLSARELGMPIGLYIDLAVGVDPNGADAWSEQDDILSNVTIGAPPDQYNPAGQNWGLTTFNPHSLAASDCAPLRRMLGAAMRDAGAIRIDHVLGLMRLYLIPSDKGATDGAYIRYPFEAMLHAIAEESQKHRCLVIGEDLGTVPDGFRAMLARYGVWTYLVMLFEREQDGHFRAPASYPENALATFSTHDLPTFAGWMSGGDLSFKRSLGIDPGETDDERASSRCKLLAALHIPEAGFEDAVGFLGSSNARLVMVAIEDIAGVEEQINIPGTVEEHPNWRRRLPMSIDAFFASERFQRVSLTLAGRSFAS